MIGGLLMTDQSKLTFLYKSISIASLFIIVATTSYGFITAITQDVNAVGETLVTFEVPPISVFPLFYSKPITWLSAALIALFYSVLELNKERVYSWSPPRRDFLKLIAFFVGAMALYEVFFNFTLWSGLIARDSIIGELNVDLIRNPFPNPQTPWNIVFATKLFTVLTILSLYSVYYLQRIESKYFGNANNLHIGQEPQGEKQDSQANNLSELEMQKN
jgi:hypothetical protein